MTDWIDEDVVVVNYDPVWPVRFRDEARLLDEAIGPWIVGGIHHVGSTAVTGLAAKPVIDILVGVENLAASRPCIARLAPLHYLYSDYRPDEMHWFCKPDPARRTHHLHLVPVESDRYADELMFRDYLRTHPDRRDAYGELKRSLAITFRKDREAYTEGKSAFVRETLRLGREARAGGRACPQ